VAQRRQKASATAWEMVLVMVRDVWGEKRRSLMG